MSGVQGADHVNLPAREGHACFGDLMRLKAMMRMQERDLCT